MAPMEEMLNRFFTNLLERTSDPLNVRFLLQPVVAIFFGVRRALATRSSTESLIFEQ